MLSSMFHSITTEYNQKETIVIKPTAGTTAMKLRLRIEAAMATNQPYVELSSVEHEMLRKAFDRPSPGLGKRYAAQLLPFVDAILERAAMEKAELELRAMGYRAIGDSEESTELCGNCNGSGEGFADGDRCGACKGWGEL